MKTWKLLLPVPALAVLLAMMPQDPAAKANPVTEDVSQIVRMSELQYVDNNGKTNVIPSRNVIEIRLLNDSNEGIQLEIIYENGDYSLINAQAMHILVGGRDLMDVRLVRSKTARLRFPKLR